MTDGPKLQDRIDRAATELAALLASLPEQLGAESDTTVVPRRGSAEFDDPVEFAHLLRSVRG